jgi:hypothetical protein
MARFSVIASQGHRGASVRGRPPDLTLRARFILRAWLLASVLRPIVSILGVTAILAARFQTNSREPGTREDGAQRPQEQFVVLSMISVKPGKNGAYRVGSGAARPGR